MITCPDCETGRNLLAGACRSVFQRGLTGGSAGNMSLRVEGGILATPTGIPFVAANWLCTSWGFALSSSSIP